MPPGKPFGKRAVIGRMLWGISRPPRQAPFRAAPAHFQQARHSTGVIGRFVGGLLRDRNAQPEGQRTGIRSVNYAGNQEAEMRMRQREAMQEQQEVLARAANDIKEVMNSMGFVRRNPAISRQARDTVFELRFVFFTAVQEAGVRDFRGFQRYLAQWVEAARRNPQLMQENPHMAGLVQRFHGRPAGEVAAYMNGSLVRSFSREEQENLRNGIGRFSYAATGRNPYED